MIPRIIRLGMGIVLVCGIIKGEAALAQAGQKEQIPKKEAIQETETKPEKKTVTKSIDGEVAGISPTFIAVDYGLNAKGTAMQEMSFIMAKDVKIEVKKSLKDINVGDTVRVTYEETTETNGKITRALDRSVKVIRFLSAAPKAQEPNPFASREKE